MNAQMDAPATMSPISLVRHPKGYELKGEIAISLSICESDFVGAQALLDLILLFEPLNHVPLVISIAGGPEALPERDWYDFKAKATGFFKSVSINKVRDVRPAYVNGPNSLARDWRPNNNMFRGVADYFQHFGKGIGAFYYLEPDCVPLKRDWFSQLAAQYELARRPFMGVIRQAKTNEGTNLPQHMNGSGIYPNPVVQYSGALYVASMNQHPEAAPFDVAGGSSVVPLCMPTKLICVDFSANPIINSEAVVWHGDKRNQMKHTMIEKFGGLPSSIPDLVTPVSDQRPHFQSGSTAELLNMPETISEAMRGDSLPKVLDSHLDEKLAPKLNTLIDSRPTTLTPPKNAYEAYLRSLRAFGHCKASWMRAVKAFKAEKK